MLSLPAREVWVEISFQSNFPTPKSGHFPRGKYGLKLYSETTYTPLSWSHSEREVWIEILLSDCFSGGFTGHFSRMESAH